MTVIHYQLANRCNLQKESLKTIAQMHILTICLEGTNTEKQSDTNSKKSERNWTVYSICGSEQTVV